MIICGTTNLLSPSSSKISVNSLCHTFLLIVLFFLISGSGQAQNLEFTLLPERPAKAIHFKDSPVYLDLSSVDSMYTQKSNELLEGNTFESHIRFSHSKDVFHEELNKTIQEYKKMNNTSMEMIPLQDREASGTLIHIIHGEDPAHRQITWIAIIGWRDVSYQIEGSYPLPMHPLLGRNFVNIFQSIHLDKS